MMASSNGLDKFVIEGLIFRSALGIVSGPLSERLPSVSDMVSGLRRGPPLMRLFDDIAESTSPLMKENTVASAVCRRIVAARPRLPRAC